MLLSANPMVSRTGSPSAVPHLVSGRRQTSSLHTSACWDNDTPEWVLTQTWTSGLFGMGEGPSGDNDFAGDVKRVGAGADGACCAHMVAGA